MMINIKAWQDVATADVVEAYLQTYMTDYVIVKLTGDNADIMYKNNKEYKTSKTLL